MLEKLLIKAIREQLLAGFALLNITTQVKQSNQPTQQGVPTGPVVLMSIVDNRRYGSPYRANVYNSEAEDFDHVETQVYETTLQFDALLPQTPTDAAQITAGDLVNYAAYILQSSRTIEALQVQGIGIERITQVRNPHFDDDRDQFESSPSFDCVFTHKQIVTSSNPMLQSTELQIFSV